MTDDAFNLARFIEAQQEIYTDVVQELQKGKKRLHWMWFIFPQMLGLSHSETGRFYAIRTLAEAIAYLQHPILGQRLMECCTIILTHQQRSAVHIFGPTDAAKLKSSMSLFYYAAEQIDHPSAHVFKQVLAHYFNAELDARTLAILQQHA